MRRGAIIVILLLCGALTSAAQDCKSLVAGRFMIREVPDAALALLANLQGLEGTTTLRVWPELKILVVEAPFLTAASLQTMVRSTLTSHGFDTAVEVVPDEIVWRPLVVYRSSLSSDPYPSPWPEDLDGTGVTVGLVDGPLFERDDLVATRVCCWEPCPVQPDNHGTHVAGIIAGRRGTGAEGAGVAGGVTLLSSPFTIGHCGSLVQAIEAARCAISKGARIINCSWGLGSDNEALRDFIRQNPDVLFVAAAGNHGDERQVYPAAFDEPNVLGVTFTFSYGKLTEKSNRGDWVDIAARGVSIRSTMGRQGTGSLSGSSQAAPFVSGAAALLMERFPDLSGGEVRDILVRSADPQIEGIGGGMLDFDRALEMASRCADPSPAGTDAPVPP